VTKFLKGVYESKYQICSDSLHLLFAKDKYLPPVTYSAATSNLKRNLVFAEIFLKFMNNTSKTGIYLISQLYIRVKLSFIFRRYIKRQALKE
jgi:hypothetical protein